MIPATYKLNALFPVFISLSAEGRRQLHGQGGWLHYPGGLPARILSHIPLITGPDLE